MKGIRDRYDGVRRNPWNQIEWGNHYSRAMASYSVLLALSGFRYSAVENEIVLSSANSSGEFSMLLCGGFGLGNIQPKSEGRRVKGRD